MPDLYAIGLVGRLIMLLAWVGLIALVVWVITRLFPGRPRPARPVPHKPQQPDDTPRPTASVRR